MAHQAKASSQKIKIFWVKFSGHREELASACWALANKFSVKPSNKVAFIIEFRIRRIQVNILKKIACGANFVNIS